MASFNVSSFVSKISDRGLARTNRFQVTFVPPSVIGFSEDYRQVSLSCESAELPGRDLTTTDSRIYGPTFKTPYMSNYNDISFTFICDAALVEKRVFDSWMSAINPTTSFDFAYRDDYVSTVLIEQLTDNEIVSYSCGLIEAFPIQVNSMPVNWGEDNFHRVTITMTYRYWTETGGREEQEQNLMSSRQEAQQIAIARENQRRDRDIRKTVLRNRGSYYQRLNYGQKTRNDELFVTPEPNITNAVDVQVTPPNI